MGFASRLSAGSSLPKRGIEVAQARTGLNCCLAEGEREQLVDTVIGKPYDPAVSCNVKGGTLLCNEAAAAATTVAVKEFRTATFGLNKWPAEAAEFPWTPMSKLRRMTTTTGRILPLGRKS